MKRRAAGEQGSALIIALFFTTVVAILVSQVVTFADAGLRAGRSQDARRASVYAADGATEAAINRFAGNGPCDDYIAPLVDHGGDANPVNEYGTVVRCRTEAVPGGAFLNKPRHALLALGTDPGEGIASGADLRVQGDIFSHSTVTTGGTLITQGDISALGDCTPANPPDRIRVDPQTDPPTLFERCANTGGGADPIIGADPDYTRPLDAVPALRTVPACPVTAEAPDAWLVELQPGYYDDAAALSALTTGGCPNAVIWLRPGDYYFDFTFGSGPGTGAGTWTVNDPTVVVVAGTPKGWNADGSEPRPDTVEVPGSCRADGDPAPIDGVHLVMGGESHLQVDAGQVELCAQPSATDQQIALYGNPGERPNRTLKPVGVSTSGFTGQASALLIGEKDRVSGAPAVARADLDAAEATEAALTLTGYRPQIPAGALIQSATLLVAHREEGDLDNVDVAAAVVFNGDTCGAQALPLTGSMVTDRLDVKACGLDTPAEFGAVSVTHTVELREGGAQAAAELDGMWIEVVYREPETRKPTAAVDVVGFTNPHLAFEIGERPAALATAALDSSETPTAELTLRGLGEPPIPPGSTIDSAVLRVAHREDELVAPPTLSLAVGPAECSGPPLAISSVAMADDRLDIKPCIDDAGDLVGLTATYEVGLGVGSSSATAELDGIWLELVYTPPTTRPASGAVGAGFDAPENATAIDGTAAATPAPLSDPAPTASVTLTGYDLPAVPRGSAIDSAELRIAHQDPAEVAPSVHTVFGDATVCDRPLEARPSLREDGTFDEHRVDLKACGLNTTDRLAGLSVTFTVSLVTAGTVAADVARLDGVVLVLSYRPPSTRSPDTVGALTAFTDPENAFAIGEQPTPLAAVAALSRALDPPQESASITLSGYDRLPLPPGSVLESAVLRVAHRDDGDIHPSGPSVAVAFPGATCTSPQPQPIRPGSFVEERIDLVATCGLTEPAQLAGLAVTYAVALADEPPPPEPPTEPVPASATASLDGVVLDLVFRAPRLRPLDGCLATVAYPANPAACALVRAGPDSRFIVQGTVYTPTAALDISMQNVDRQVFPRGLIARHLALTLTPAVGFKRPILGVPPEAVRFTAYPDRTRLPTEAVTTAPEHFDAASQAVAIDGTAATADLDVTGKPTAEISLEGFDAPAVPEGTAIDGVVLRVVHQEEGQIQSVDVTVHLFDSEGNETTLELDPLAHRAGMEEVRIPLPGVTAAQLGSITVDYRVTIDPSATEPAVARLDGMSLQVFSRPIIRAQVVFEPGRTTIQNWTVL